MTDRQEPSVAYLVSRYPHISHTFILREVAVLRQAGLRIETASVNDPDRPPERLTAEERAEAAATFYIKRAGVSGACSAHLRAFLAHPLRYLQGLAFSLSLGGADLRQVAFGILYFVEAVMVGVWMQSRGIRHLHVHFATPASTVGLIARRAFPISLSITVHGPDEFYDVQAYRLREKIAGSDFICCIGMYARSQLMKLSAPEQWPKFEVCPLGVDPDAFVPRPFREKPAPFNVLCVGRLVEAKGQHILIAAVDRLVQSGRDVELCLVGDGPDRASLEKSVARRGLQARVTFTGSVNQDEIREYYRRADVFALASFAEGIPVVLMEAMAMEIPCVTTCITGIPELIRDGIDGFLVLPSDEKGLAEAIAGLQQNPGLCREIGQAGRLRVIEKYNLGKNTLLMAEVFQRRLGGCS